jgi:hypothetical protein
MDDDILTMLYNKVIKGDTYEYITSKEESDALLLEEYPHMDDDDDIFKTIYNELLSGIDAYTAFTVATTATTAAATAAPTTATAATAAATATAATATAATATPTT